jgi:formylglycine-generating enzyme
VGLSPCYYTDANMTILYRSGTTPAPPVVWSANGYRLPTEAEWEKAARGGAMGHRFPWSDSDTITHSRANYYSQAGFSYDTSLTRSWHSGYTNAPTPYTSPVGAFAANDYGLYDMAGNIAEWCWDSYDSGWYGTAGASQMDCRGPAYGSTSRVVRGGSWNDRANNPRCADRSNESQFNAWAFLGFRCVRRP